VAVILVAETHVEDRSIEEREAPNNSKEDTPVPPLITETVLAAVNSANEDGVVLSNSNLSGIALANYPLPPVQGTASEKDIPVAAATYTLLVKFLCRVAVI